MPNKPRPKPKRKPAKRKLREDMNQTAYRVMQEVIRRSEAAPKTEKAER